MLRLSQHKNVQFKWLNKVKCILDEAGFSEYWTDQNSLNPKFLKLSLKQRLHDQFIQRWLSNIDNSPKGKLYSCIKSEFRLEPYLLKLTAINRVFICKLRTCNLKLQIETADGGIYHQMRDIALYVKTN